jgi:hypothetical protein
MAKLRVRRKAYKRKPYTRKGGVRVEGAKVPATTFSIKDRGKPGRTPEEERFFDPQVHTGWKADMPAGKRRNLVRRAHKGDILASARAMQALANVQHRINPDVARKAKADADYFFRLNDKKRGKR